MPFLVVIGLQVLCIVHLMRTGRNPLWLTALIFLPVVSALAYLIVEVLPGLGSNRHVRTARAKAIETIDPERELRGARDALGLADTAANRLRVADALAALGRHGEAVPLYRESIAMTPGEPDVRSQGKLARALFETGQATRRWRCSMRSRRRWGRASATGRLCCARGRSIISGASRRHSTSMPTSSRACPARKRAAAMRGC